ncbi:hypothetical protein VULLAG_LOCUS16034 [Vulpes lagopus]
MTQGSARPRPGRVTGLSPRTTAAARIPSPATHGPRRSGHHSGACHPLEVVLRHLHHPHLDGQVEGA